MTRAPRLPVLMTVLAALAGTQAWCANGKPDEPAAARASSAGETLEEVQVTAQREDLTRRVSKFVKQLAVQENGGEAGLARWLSPSVCPLVAGLPRRDGEFILERLTQRAQDAGAPLGGEHCRPNLYILVTPQPEELLKGMEKRNRQFTFGFDVSTATETADNVVDAFITKPRPVRVWYNSAVRDHWGQLVGYCPAPLGVGRFMLCVQSISGGSHLLFDTRYTFTRVFVVVDRGRLKGVSLGQIADYVAMVGLAKLKLDARVAGNPTILNLFDSDPGAAPTAMTDWDRAFLKSLYATEQSSRQQRGQIARSMVRDLLP